MSQHIYKTGDYVVTLGYDRPLDYVFCVIERASNGEILYSNLDDPWCECEQQDVMYYKRHLDFFQIVVPESVFNEVIHDQAMKIGNKVVDHTVVDSQGAQ